MADDRRQTHTDVDQGVHDPEMTEQDEANAPDVDEPDHDKVARDIQREGDKSA